MMNTGIPFMPFVLLLFFSAACQKGADLNVNSIDELEEKLHTELEDKSLTSIAYCIVKNDRLIYSNALGYANKNLNRQATDSTRYLVASISKTITGVALMQLVDQGLVSLDDDINLHLPFSVRNPDYPDDRITYRMLLSHTSSISDDFQNTLDLYCYGTDCNMSLEQYFNEVFLPTGQYFSSDNFSDNMPGINEDYSNLGAALIGYLVEKISNTPFDEYCKNHIFTPLGMTKTEWRLSETPIPELAVPYSPDLPSSNPQYTFPDYPNGGLRTNVLDLSKFLRMIMLKGTFQGVQILSELSAETMKLRQFGSAEQCLAFYYDTVNGTEVLGHSGGEMGVTTEMYFDVVTNVGVIVFNNDDDADLGNVVKLLFNYGQKQ